MMGSDMGPMEGAQRLHCSSHSSLQTRQSGSGPTALVQSHPSASVLDSLVEGMRVVHIVAIRGQGVGERFIWKTGGKRALKSLPDGCTAPSPTPAPEQ